jgi:predicted metal-dependent HD superfamily phosphohydrolase
MIENPFFDAIKAYVFSTFKNDMPAQIVYHNFDHTVDVVNAAFEIGTQEGISEDDMEVLLTAAWFHDIGFTSVYQDHEKVSAAMAEKYLKENGYPEEKIEQVSKLILSTCMPQKPTTLLEEVLCDADLYHLGSEAYIEKSSLLRTEWELAEGKQLTDAEWYSQGDNFFNKHRYFTNYAYNTFNAQKMRNWIGVQKNLRKAVTRQEELDLKMQLKSEDRKRKKVKESRPDRGIETMYRVTLRNHIKLSDIADTKANILLSVSAIILSIALSTLFPKLDKPDNYYLIYPTLIFLFITVLTMIYSILSTRPKVTSGKFTQEDVENKKVNLLFFGNFHKMPLKDFQAGMSQVMEDRDYLYKSLMKDLYYLGKVLERKYRLLRIAYNIFMVGIILSVVAFIIAFQVMKNQGVGTSLI